MATLALFYKDVLDFYWSASGQARRSGGAPTTSDIPLGTDIGGDRYEVRYPWRSLRCHRRHRARCFEKQSTEIKTGGPFTKVATK